ncbi:hypothetical protein [Paenibacillus xylanilyticus]|uniref:LysM domain-containing protein n=1 Tax=Paenibacillus xylanilyticus TaxID=248903 RepID=A0A7Y6C0Y8_9BACL|nr:hypothetical protein [Paenibacillus xylanilyticus]NUU78486.1 hypothetical protein [Paenibacillus xylanilyticus]
MKHRWKTWLASGMTAIFILAVSGNAVSASSVKKPDSTDQKTPATSTSDKHPCIQAGHGLFMIGETADLLGIGLRDLKEQMELGKTLTQIAKERKGLSEEQLLQKLKPSLAKRLDQAAADGCLTKEQVSAAKAGMDEKLKKVINTPLRELRREFAGHGRKHPSLNHKTIAQFIGITPEQLQEQLKSGKSLAEVAKAHGISEAQLIDKLKEQLTGDLQRLVNRKGGAHQAPREQAPGHPASTESD